MIQVIEKDTDRVLCEIESIDDLTNKITACTGIGGVWHIDFYFWSNGIRYTGYVGMRLLRVRTDESVHAQLGLVDS